MKYIIIFISLILPAGCNQSDSNKSEKKSASDTAHLNDLTKKTVPDIAEKPVAKKDSILSKANDTLVMQASMEIVKALKEKNIIKLSSFILPEYGIRFSYSAFIDTMKEKIFSAKQLAFLNKSQQLTDWGVREFESDKTIKMSLNQYFKKFVYDVDYLNAEKKSINKFLAGGTNLNNLKQVYPGCDFTEFYFSGFDPKYGGMDWRTLRLVFRMKNNKSYIVAIIHDEWNI